MGSALLAASCGDDDGDGATAALAVPGDGATVFGGVAVEMGADGVTIEAAGEAREGTGHFHVIVDDACIDPGTAVPRDADHVHFGDGQSAGTVYLGPGEHELCLQVADGAHTALDITDTATVTVRVGTRDEWCDVIGDVDVLFTETDNSSEEFAVKQVAYGHLIRLLAQLTDGINLVEADVRDAVATALEQGSFIAGTFAEAADAQAAEEELWETFGAAGVSIDADAARWISETCDVDIDS